MQLLEMKKLNEKCEVMEYKGKIFKHFINVKINSTASGQIYIMNII